MKTKKLHFHFHSNDNFLKNLTTCIENINIYFYIFDLFDIGVKCDLNMFVLRLTLKRFQVFGFIMVSSPSLLFLSSLPHIGLQYLNTGLILYNLVVLYASLG